MTAPNVIKYSEFVVKLLSVDSPGAYYAPCGITSRSFSRTIATVDSEVPDCDDETIPMTIYRGIKSTDWTIDGTFVIDNDDMAAWDERIGIETGVQIDRPVGAGESGGTTATYHGTAVITKFEMIGEFGQKAITGSITIVGAGPLSKTVITPG